MGKSQWRLDTTVFMGKFASPPVLHGVTLVAIQDITELQRVRFVMKGATVYLTH